jgi:SpoIID/LytB domain
MEATVSIGILWNKSISFSLGEDYSFNGKPAEGEWTAGLKDGKVSWNGGLYDELIFQPQQATSSFRIKDVVIGINFHWERKEDQQFQGSLKLIVDNDQLIAINILSVEDYLTSVISSEMSATASLELLKAHAVISRSWLLAQIEKNKELVSTNASYAAFTETDSELIRWYDREDHTLFDVCADDHCQRYQGITRAFANLDTVKQAIRETRGEVLLSEGKICDARFSKCCGGVVEEFQNCWENKSFPYLIKLRDAAGSREVPDLTNEADFIQWVGARPEAFCNTTDKAILGQVLNNYDQETTDFYRWEVRYSQKELSELAHQRSGIDFGTIQELIPVERGTSGRLIKLKIVGTKKTMTIGKELEIRRTLSTSHLYSSAFIIRKEGDCFILKGAGWGHGVGLCQIGAAVMGEQGYTYDKILRHYYIGADIKRLY